MRKGNMKELLRRYNIEISLIVLSLALGGFMLSYVSQRPEMTVALEEQGFHLNSSRLVSDSLTPGLGNFGYNSVLLHMFMAPFSAIDQIYYAGLSAFPVLVIFLAVSVVLLYKTVFVITDNRILGFASALFFLLNPYTLYFSATPMPYILLFANLLAASYLAALWLKSGKTSFLVLCAVFVFLAALSAPEGLMLIPALILIILARHISRRGRTSRAVDSIPVIIFVAACAVLALTHIHPYFHNIALSAFGEPDSQAALFGGNMLSPLNHLLQASYNTIGRFPVIISFVSFFALLIFPSRRRFLSVSVLILFISPFLFAAANLWQGELFLWSSQSSAAGLENLQYGFLLILFSSAAPVLFLGALNDDLGRRYRSGGLKKTLSDATLIFLAGISLWQFNRIIFADNFEHVRSEASRSVRQEDFLAEKIKEEYDFGQILCARAGKDRALLMSELPLRIYTNENNGIFYAQSMDSPWLFARWVIMENNSARPQSADPVSDRWKNSESFNLYYNLYAENDSVKIYKVNEGKIRDLAAQAAYDVSKIPSMEKEATTWEPQSAYRDMGAQVVLADEEVSLGDVQSALGSLYVSKMKSDYRSGYLAVDGNTGNSETQSYILMQAMMTDDRETFEIAWRWTKENVQRSEDNLFSWKFTLENGRANISDRNPATDADEDIAYALLRAGEKWSRPDYIEEGKLIINDIWNRETASYGGKRYVLAGDWANSPQSLVINPSYFSPFSYRLFAKYDSQHNWNGLIEDGYDLLERSSQKNLESGLGLYLPPDWISLNKQTGELEPFNGLNFSFKHSYDAFRVFWRVAADENINSSARARSYLNRTGVFLSEWQNTGKVHSIFEFSNGGYAGKTVLATMAGPLSALSVTQPQAARGVARTYYAESGTVSFRPGASFYERSWYWFGLYLWSGGQF